MARRGRHQLWFTRRAPDEKLCVLQHRGDQLPGLQVRMIETNGAQPSFLCACWRETRVPRAVLCRVCPVGVNSIGMMKRTFPYRGVLGIRH